MNQHSAWPEERIAALKELIAAKRYSASEIASILGCTRNAAIGKAHRLGLSLSGTVYTYRPRQPKKEKPAVIVVSEPPPPPRPKKPSKPVPMLGLGPHDCKWPIGDPQEPSFGFCGAWREFDVPYCTEHAAIAFQASSPRGRRPHHALSPFRRGGENLSLPAKDDEAA